MKNCSKSFLVEDELESGVFEVIHRVTGVYQVSFFCVVLDGVELLMDIKV